ncbi:MAG: hypothetical protein WB579_09880 [Bryobacteraceae bacterium]
MGELVPFLSAFALGTVIWRTSRGFLRTGLTLCAIIGSGLAATLLSGEYHVSRWFLLPDIAESAVGVAAAAATSRIFLSICSSSSRMEPSFTPNPQDAAFPGSRK